METESTFSLSGAIDLLTKIYDKTERDGECVVWQGARNGGVRGGYGHMTHEGRTVYVHRTVAKLTHPRSIDGMDIDHVWPQCHSRACIRWDHLQAVSHGENIRRAVARRRAEKDAS